MNLVMLDTYILSVEMTVVLDFLSSVVFDFDAIFIPL